MTPDGMTSTEAPVSIDPGAHLVLVQKGWLTHDAMWFAHSVSRLGIEAANELNRGAARAMAAVEAKRVRKLAGIDEIRTHHDLRRFFDAAIAWVIPAEVMDYEVRWADDDRAVRFEITRCFAHDGTTLLGVAERYECGIFERIEGWLDGLGVSFTTDPSVAHCTMHHEGWCRRTFRFALGDPEGCGST